MRFKEDDYDIDDEDLYGDYDDDVLIQNYVGVCELYDGDREKEFSCFDCEKYDECLERAEDNKCGYEMFCDIVSDAYGSVDAFWECNGI
jgi:hypothetical protein